MTAVVLRFACWLAMTACAITATVAIWTALATAAERSEAAEQARSLVESADRIIRLRHEVGSGVEAARPDADLVARVQAALADAGLPPSSLGGIHPRGEEPVGEGLRIQRVEIELLGMTPARMGAWLARWHRAADPWTLHELSFEHDPNDRTGEAFRATLVFAACYAETSP